MAQKRDGLYKRGRFWWIRTDPVTGKARSTYCSDLEAARLYRAKRERLAADPAHAAAETARLDEWIRRVIAVKEHDGSSAATIEVYRTKLGHWLRLAPDAMLAEVDPGFVDAFVAQRRREEVSDHTISKEVTHLCTVLKVAKRAGCYPGDIATLRPPSLHAGYKPRKRALTREEVVALMAELKPELAALVAICVSLGCRLSEAYRLQPSDVGPNSVHIRGTKTDESDRKVPILSIFASLFAVGARQLPLGSEPNNLRRDLAAACARAGIQSATPNDLRRTHATLLAEAGVDRDVTRRLLGHTTTRLVDTVYGQPTTEALGALAEAKLVTAVPLTESPRHVAPEGEADGTRDPVRAGDEQAPTGGGDFSERRETAGSGIQVREAGDRGAPTLASISVRGPAIEGDKRAAETSDSGARGRRPPLRHRASPAVAGTDGEKHERECADSGRAGSHREGDERTNVNALHGRDSKQQAIANPGADFEIRTRDLRFTKPVSNAPYSGVSYEYAGLSWPETDELGQVHPSGVTRTRQYIRGLVDARLSWGERNRLGDFDPPRSSS